MNPSAIPSQLRAREQWVVWRIEQRGGKPTKVPYQAAHPQAKAKPDDSRTWGTFEQACAVKDVDGIGYVFAAADPFAGVDLDACVDEHTGELHPAADEIVTLLNSYHELSPSGRGMHVIVMGRLHGRRRRTSNTPWGHEFECYDQGRYFTITGRGGGEIAPRQVQLDQLVARMFGSSNGAGPAVALPLKAVRPLRKAPGSDAKAILARHDDLARIAARKGVGPKGGTPSDWDYMLAARAAEQGYDDGVIESLIRHARHLHGEQKGERVDYVQRTVEAVRRRIGRVGPGVRQQDALGELTKALRLDEVKRRVVGAYVAGHGNSAAAAIVLDDDYSIEFERFEHVAQPEKLADQLACTVGLTTSFNKIQARRVASLVRSIAGRGEELREHALYVDEALRLLKLAQTIEFDFSDQADKWLTWSRLDEIDPEEIPAPPQHETEAQRRRRESRTVELYARRLLVPVDRAGVHFVRANWLQQFMRLAVGSSSTPQRARQAMLRAGWRVRGREGRIKASHSDGRELVFAFYLVPTGWRERQAGDGR